MFLTKKLNNGVVAVVDIYPVSISVRKSGKEYFGTERSVCKIENNKLVINKEVADNYGLEIIIK